MNCPACKEPMIVLEYRMVELDYCAACHGVWLDRGELELLLDGMGEIPPAAAGEPVTGEKPRRCPICLRRMKKSLRGAEPRRLTVDECARGHGYWFDEGELRELLAQGAPDNPVLAWIGEVFGMDAAVTRGDGVLNQP